ncbi:MAG: GAF domain-containing protein [Candidatus Neomarinimicrobiota bacterium]
MKKSIYEKIYKTLKSLFNSNPPLSFQAKMSLSTSVLAYQFENWIFCGFYVSCNKRNLEIGPYQGKILPCTNIKYGAGVCGTSALKQQTIIVNNVHDYENYISCDSDTNSEIVIPVFNKKRLIAVLDIDSNKRNDFDEIDKENLEKISKLFFE